MSYYVYILYSEVQNKYYIGSTQDVTERLDRHNSGKENYTRKYIPWNLVLSLKKATRSEAFQLEIKIELYQCDLYFSSIYLGVMQTLPLEVCMQIKASACRMKNKFIFQLWILICFSLRY